MIGDVIECVFSVARTTGSAIPQELHAHRHALMASFRDFSEAMDDIFRVVFRSWRWPSKSSGNLDVAHFPTIVLLAHAAHTARPSEQGRVRHTFASLCRAASRVFEKDA